MLTIFRMPLISFYSLLAALVFHFCLSLSLFFSRSLSLFVCCSACAELGMLLVFRIPVKLSPYEFVYTAAVI